MNALETILNNETRSEASFEKKSSMYQKLVRGVASTSIALAAFLGSGTAADMITPTSAYAEESQLNIPSLNEGNYRQVINSCDKCVVMYYIEGGKDLDLGYRFLAELKQRAPKRVNFYKVNILTFSKNEQKRIVYQEIEKNIFPTTILYISGKQADRNRGSPDDADRTEQVEEIIKKM